MNIELLDNTDSNFVRKIVECLSWASVAHIGVAYATYPIFSQFKVPFELFLRKNGRLRVLFDIERFITDVKIIEEFATIPGDSVIGQLKVYHSWAVESVPPIILRKHYL